MGNPITMVLDKGMRKIHRCRHVEMLCVAVLFLPTVPTHAAQLEDDEMSTAIVQRCIHAMGEFGSEGIAACVTGDKAAIKALEAMPLSAHGAIGRCAGELQQHGWAMVKICADRDLAAEAALADYPGAARDALAECRKREAGKGAASVQACADAALATRR